MKTMSDLCKTCNHHKTVFTRGYYRFFRDRKYYCDKKHKLIEKALDCDCYEKRVIESDISEDRLLSVESDIKYLYGIFKKTE